MDNSSKALIMAGAVLIALLVISLTLYMLNAIRDYNENESRYNKSSQDEAFNRYFVTSSYSNDGMIYGYEAYNLIKKAKDINDRDEGHITFDVLGSTFSSDPSSYFEGGNMLNKFHYSYQYGSDGRIKSIKIY